MTEYTRRELREVTYQALADMAADTSRGPVTRDQALTAAGQLKRRQPRPDLREPYVYRYTLQPGLHLVVDASHNILLEVRTPDEAELLAAYALSGVMGMINQLEICRDAADADAEEAEMLASDAHLAGLAHSAGNCPHC